MTVLEWLGAAAIVWLCKLLWDHHRQQHIQPLGPFIHTDQVDAEEFSRILTEAVVDARSRNILVALLDASGNHVTVREMIILKYLLRKCDEESFVDAIIRMTETQNKQERLILTRQLKILKVAVR